MQPHFIGGKSCVKQLGLQVVKATLSFTVELKVLSADISVVDQNNVVDLCYCLRCCNADISVADQYSVADLCYCSRCCLQISVLRISVEFQVLSPDQSHQTDTCCAEPRNLLKLKLD